VSIEYRDKRFVTKTAHGEKYLSEGLVVATPAYVAADLCMPLEKSIASALGQIPYAGIVVRGGGLPSGGRRARPERVWLPGAEGGAAAGAGVHLDVVDCFPQQAPEGYACCCGRCMAVRWILGR
jgi:protoporphyrinogen oxidase